MAELRDPQEMPLQTSRRDESLGPDPPDNRERFTIQSVVRDALLWLVWSERRALVPRHVPRSRAGMLVLCARRGPPGRQRAP